LDLYDAGWRMIGFVWGMKAVARLSAGAIWNQSAGQKILAAASASRYQTAWIPAKRSSP
jgi:hypothetical protein